MRSGVPASRVFLPAGAWPTLLDFLCERFPHVTRDDWQQRFERGDVTNDKGQALPASAPYHSGHVHYHRHVPNEATLPMAEEMVFVDEHIVVADKPHFLAVTPGGAFASDTLQARLQRRLLCTDLQPVHRLDRDTAGLVLFCRRREERDAYHALFRDGHVHKVYEAVAPRVTALQGQTERRSRLASDTQFFRQREVDGPPNAHTRIRMLETLPHGLARYQLEPVTGQRHQLRVHMAALGAPIANDPYYPEVTRAKGARDDWSRPLQLLARRLEFVDPLTREARVFESSRHLG